MASKRLRTIIGLPPPSSSRSRAQTWDVVKFSTEEAYQRYTQNFLSRSLVPERGLRPDDKLDGQMNAMISKMKWVHFTKPSEFAVVAVVKEFYANAIPDGPPTAPVRGKLIPFNSRAINAVYRTPNFNGRDY